MKTSLEGTQVSGIISRTEAARRFGIPEEKLREIESGRNIPDVKTTRLMEDVYLVSYNNFDFLRGSAEGIKKCVESIDMVETLTELTPDAYNYARETMAALAADQDDNCRRFIEILFKVADKFRS